MNVEIVAFPRTKAQTGRVETRARPAGSLKTPQHGIHYTDPRSAPPHDHRVDFCLSIEHDVASNSLGVVTKIIPANRCARARYWLSG